MSVDGSVLVFGHFEMAETKFYEHHPPTRSR